jgi:FkbM family methyltransferase
MQGRVYFLGEYEAAELHLWKTLTVNASVMFDVGANQGLFSLLAAEANPNVSITAFEPCYQMYTQLKRNIARNNVANIKAIDAAVGGSDGRVWLNTCFGADGNNEGMHFTTQYPETVGAWCSVRSLDSYVSEHNIKYVDALKVDVEGNEHEVFKGAERLLREQRIGGILFERIDWAESRANASLDDTLAQLRNSGYSVYKLAGPGKLVSFEPERDKSCSLLAVCGPLKGLFGK